MHHWRGKWAAITGASAGIGVALARELAAGGTHLLLTARREDRLRALAAELSAKHAVSVEVCVADLARPEGPEEVFAFSQDKKLPIALLVNNAGFGAYGEFQRRSRQWLADMVQVNVAAVVQLTHLYVPGMIERKEGDILIVASTAAFQAVPYMATYAATKGFDLLFAEGLAAELRRYGVRVCALCPGSTRSEFSDVAGSRARERSRESAEKVARVALAGLAAGKSTVISGLNNWLAVESERLVPRRVVTRMVERMFRPR